MREIIAHALSGTLPFKGVAERRLLRMADDMEGAVVRYSPGRTVAIRGATLDHLMLLVDGQAQAEIFSADGHHLRVERFFAPEIIASSILFAPEPILPVTVTSVSRCTLAGMARERLLFHCREDRDVLLGLLHDMGRRTAFLANRLRLSEFATLRQKIAVFLVDEMDRRGTSVIRPTLSRETLADMFGVARPSLSRELGNMAREGIVRCEGSTIEILDEAAIRTLQRGCD